eukprot:COSAG04_NODE_1929_length_5198_cov_2.596195_3_plen_88_part_00
MLGTARAIKTRSSIIAPAADASDPTFGASPSSENSGWLELKEGGQVSCDTARNLNLTCSYITRGGRGAAWPHADTSTSFAFCSGICV